MTPFATVAGRISLTLARWFTTVLIAFFCGISYQSNFNRHLERIMEMMPRESVRQVSRFRQEEQAATNSNAAH